VTAPAPEPVPAAPAPVAVAEAPARRPVGRAELGLALLAAVALCALMRLVTPAQEAASRVADTRLYVQMAERGVLGRAPVGAPFAYRAAFTTLAGATSRALGVPTDAVFGAMALVGLPLFLALLYLIARRATGPLNAAFAVVLVGISFSAGKRIFYNPIDPDVLGLPLTALAAWLALERRWAWLAAVTCAGVLFREFVAVPTLAAAVVEWRAGTLRRRAPATWWPLAGVAGALLTAVALRLVIPVSGSTQMLDPLHRATWRNAVVLLNSRWIANDAGAIATFMLPVLCLWRRQRGALPRPALPAWAVAYGVTLFAVTLVAGTDFVRFAAYFAPLFVILYAAEAQDEPVWLQVVLVLLMLGVNRIAEPIPPPTKDHWRYIGFAAFYSHHMDVHTATRVAELAGIVAVYRGLRALVRRSRPDV
jgi:hypothetical protein